MNIVIWKALTSSMRKPLLKRSVYNKEELLTQTLKIIEEVKVNQDEGLKKLTQTFDKANINEFEVKQQEIGQAEKNISKEEMKAMTIAIQRLKANALSQLPENGYYDSQDGIICERQARAIQSVGLYVPGGTAPLVSTVMMLGVPAEVAGCEERILCTPPSCDGSVSPYILMAAKMCGIQKIFKVGGAQAIAAMAYGTQTIPKVDKIFGPGNCWVTQAKLLCSLYQGVSIDMPAGPSELLVIADENANPTFVAADLLSQAEHDSQSQVFLITTSMRLANNVMTELTRQQQSLERLNTITAALKNSTIILVDRLIDAIEISNQYAPEHLSLQVDKPQQWMSFVKNAGTVFLGKWAAESLGDYLTGANHVLPTFGAARAVSGLSVLDFMKWIGFQHVSSNGLATIAKYAGQLANIEELKAHENAVKIRLEVLQNER